MEWWIRWCGVCSRVEFYRFLCVVVYMSTLDLFLIEINTLQAVFLRMRLERVHVYMCFNIFVYTVSPRTRESLSPASPNVPPHRPQVPLSKEQIPLNEFPPNYHQSPNWCTRIGQGAFRPGFEIAEGGRRGLG